MRSVAHIYNSSWRFPDVGCCRRPAGGREEASVADRDRSRNQLLGSLCSRTHSTPLFLLATKLLLPNHSTITRNLIYSSSTYLIIPNLDCTTIRTRHDVRFHSRGIGINAIIDTTLVSLRGVTRGVQSKAPCPDGAIEKTTVPVPKLDGHKRVVFLHAYHCCEKVKKEIK